jgi:outer membrane protein OmpA-like peptidoglycan-associated protein
MGSCVALASVLVAGMAWSSRAAADDHIRGVIESRGADGSLTVLTDDSSTIVVVLSDATKVRRTDGMRQIKVSSASLIPGLRIHAEGEYDGTSRFGAHSIDFSRSDLKIAKDIQGGIDVTDRRSLENQKRIEEGARIIAQQQRTLAQQAEQIASNRENIRLNNEKIVATTGALNARIENLDDFKVISTVTVYFKNGKAAIAPKYKTQLQQLAGQAQGVSGYVVQVQGYASAVGSEALNTKLSMQRADNVAAILNQSGIPPTQMVVPAAMGIKDQVASNKTAKGQAENRRTVVTLLQNKGLAK